MVITQNLEKMYQPRSDLLYYE